MMIRRAALGSPKLRFEAPEALENSRQAFESSRQKGGGSQEAQSSKLKIQSFRTCLKAFDHPLQGCFFKRFQNITLKLYVQIDFPLRCTQAGCRIAPFDTAAALITPAAIRWAALYTPQGKGWKNAPGP
jgi:hypothetical protein